MGEIKFVGALLMTIIFGVAIISYVVNFGIDNSSSVKLSDDSDFSSLSSNLQRNVSLFRIDTSNGSTAFYESEISTSDETTRTGGQFKVGLSGLIFAVGGMLSLIQKKVFDDVGFAFVFTALGSFLIYIAVRYIWKTWKGGNPD